MLIINKLIDTMVGNVDIYIPEERLTDVIDLLIRNKIGYTVIDRKDCKEHALNIRASDYKKKREALDNLRVTAGITKGIPRLFKKYGKRYGAFAGAAVFSALLFISQRVVWNIEVYGCKNITEESVIEKLNELGFTYGTNYKRIDFDKLHNDYLRLYDDVAWISVNMKGTIAKVEITELSLPEDKGDGGPHNVVATESGIIVSIETHSGKPVIEIGDHVTEGDLLLTGVITVGEDGLRFADADGVITAMVRRECVDEIPKIKEEKLYTGDSSSENSLIFFKNSIKLFGKGRISQQNYDKIYNKERIYLFSEVPLPVFLESVTYKEFTVTKIPVTKGEAEASFDDSYDERLNEILCGAELVSVSRSFEETDDSYLMKYEVICIADISKKMKIAVN